jgi:hypothetical protein
MAALGERKSTLVVSFNLQSPRTSAYTIHAWVRQQLRLTEDDLRLLQVDGAKRKVYSKFVSEEKMYAVLRETGGTRAYAHENGEISDVRIEIAGMGVRKVRIANLSPEAPDSAIRAVMAKYGEIKGIVEERWARSYDFAIPNGIRVVEIDLKTHVPSHLLILGQRVLVQYDGQPFTCFGCSEEGHQYSECPHRRTRVAPAPASGVMTWAEMVRTGRAPPPARAGETVASTQRDQGTTADGIIDDAPALPQRVALAVPTHQTRRRQQSASPASAPRNMEVRQQSARDVSAIDVEAGGSGVETSATVRDIGPNVSTPTGGVSWADDTDMEDAGAVQRVYPSARSGSGAEEAEVPVDAACGSRRDVREDAGLVIPATGGRNVTRSASASPAPAVPCVNEVSRVEDGSPLPRPPSVSPTRKKKLKTGPVVAPSRHQSRTRSRF